MENNLLMLLVNVKKYFVCVCMFEQLQLQTVLEAIHRVKCTAATVDAAI